MNVRFGASKVVAVVCAALAACSSVPTVAFADLFDNWNDPYRDFAWPPIAGVPPTVVGTLAVGGALTCRNGVWNNGPTGFSINWYTDAGIKGGETYIVLPSDSGHTIRCQITASNLAGTGTSMSAAVTVPELAQEPPPPTIDTSGPNAPKPPKPVLGTITGTAGADEIQGTGRNDIINSLGGNDTIIGGKGMDLVNAGAGNDSVNTQDGRRGEIVFCGPGKDELFADVGDFELGCETIRVP